jgi:hypothetical protein
MSSNPADPSGREVQQTTCCGCGFKFCRSPLPPTQNKKWPRGLRRGFAADSLLELRVRIKRGAWMFCVASTYKWQNAGQSRQINKYGWSTHRVQENKKMKFPEGYRNRLIWVLCFFQVEVSATSRLLVQRSPADCGVSLCVCDIETSTMGRSWPALGCCTRWETSQMRAGVLRSITEHSHFSNTRMLW